MTVLPIRQVVRPSDLLGVGNGELDSALLRPVGPRGNLHHLAARAWLALVGAAGRDGIDLTYTYGGCYRTLTEQETLFRQRYTLTVLAGRPTKLWKGLLWYQRPGTAQAAVPGTSNHGLGLAVDTALGPSPDRATSIVPQLDWLLEHAPEFGWSWELQSEPWHLRYVVGDRTPPALEDRPRPADPPPTEEDDMNAKIIACDVEPEGRAEAVLTFGADGKPNLVGFNNTDERQALVKCKVERVALTAAEYDALLAWASG